ncbi:sensor histidine kinase [Paenibacillus terrigena]|uniref:sensor histidine kinase n=1 Tax=Paenibacillus terrigena TaxID=369333 RepID=UPI0003668008|nr:histidine kinase [Paenibacillus terrigena]
MTSGTNTNSKIYPLRHYIQIILIISFIVLLLDLIISVATISIVKQQSTRSLQDTADLYINRINHDFSYINHYMGWTLANDENMKTMNHSDMNSIEFLKANENIRKRFTELQKNYEQQFNFFYYLENQQLFLNCSPMNLSYSDFKELKRQVVSHLEDQDVYEKFYSRWTSMQVNNTYYIINIVPYQNSYMISMIPADELISPLRQINLGENGFVSLIDESEQNITSPISNNGKAISSQPDKPTLLNLVQTRTTVNGEFTNASFYVKLVIQFGAFEKIMIAQLLIVLLAVIIACNLCFLLFYFKKKVLTPIKTFSYNLTFWNDGGDPMEMKGSKIIELEKANKQFLHLVDQIKQYKIDIYERELEKQNIQLNYMQLQIKPHFFLNCLTTIYSMAQMQMYAEIEHMTLSTSKYFRYIFQNDQNFVNLKDEIEHVRIYLEIQKSRYRNAFIYRIEHADEASDVQIPPLVLQTFIENAVKYAVSRDNEVHIVLKVDRFIEEEMTVIQIADNGPGFPSAILAKLNAGQHLEQSDGTHIGIMNTLQRLEYLYLNKERVSFSNIEGGGACVILYLPDLPK